ncbi:MAG TPA: response regulator transcription factor [Phycisphaerae bacterium]|jgi:two-component system alkaline phosphatase synthesis response regulator PhoP
MARILVAEDEPDMLMGLRDNLQFEGYQVIEASDGLKALELAKAQRPDLMLLDIMLPKLDGLEVCKRMRESGFTLPILMLTAKSQEIDIVRGLEAGADDYVTKPFSVRELLARIKAALRRTGLAPSMSKILKIGEAEVDLVKGKVVRAGQTFSLGHFEIEILKMLIESAEKPVERNKLLDVIWGLDAFPTNRTVDNHIVSIRRKIETDAKHPQHIVTVHSIGYKFIP